MNQAHRIDDKVILVTGGAGGIGGAIVRALADGGAQVVIADLPGRGVDVANEVRERGGKVEVAGGDVSTEAGAQNAVGVTVSRFGGLDGLVNCAGISGSHRRLHETELASWERTLAVNLTGPYLCARFALPHIVGRGGGTIVNISSAFGMVGVPYAPEYCASKGGLINLTRQLAVDYGQDGIRANVVCPGYIDTDMGGHRAALSSEEAAAALARREAIAGFQPIGRQAHAREVASVVAFLCSDASSFVTGAVVPVDGGCTATFYHGGLLGPK